MRAARRARDARVHDAARAQPAAQRIAQFQIACSASAAPHTSLMNNWPAPHAPIEVFAFASILPPALHALSVSPVPCSTFRALLADNARPIRRDTGIPLHTAGNQHLKMTLLVAALSSVPGTSFAGGVSAHVWSQQLTFGCSIPPPSAVRHPADVELCPSHCPQWPNVHATRSTGSRVLQPFQRQSSPLAERQIVGRIEPVAISGAPHHAVCWSSRIRKPPRQPYLAFPRR